MGVSMGQHCALTAWTLAAGRAPQSQITFISYVDMSWFTATTRRWPNGDLMLDQLRRRWPNIISTLGKCLGPLVTCHNISKCKTLTQSWFNAGPASTLGECSCVFWHTLRMARGWFRHRMLPGPSNHNTLSNWLFLLEQRRRLWARIKTTLSERLVSAVRCVDIETCFM